MDRLRIFIVVLNILVFVRLSSGLEPTKPIQPMQESQRAERALSLASLGDDDELEATSFLATKPTEASQPWTDNLRFTLDLSSRVSLTERRGKIGTEHVVGLDLHKVFSDSEGDWGTLRLQPYMTRIDNLKGHPPCFEDDDDWEFVFRFFDFNYTRIAQCRFNIRVGHFELPYGLEHLLDTNGTLRQYIPGRNLGLKADWGISLNGVLPSFEYEVAFTRGTGNEFFHRGEPFAVSGRIGTPRDRNFIIGFSAFHGRVWSPGATALWRRGLAPPTGVQGIRGLTDTTRRRGAENVIRRAREREKNEQND